MGEGGEGDVELGMGSGHRDEQGLEPQESGVMNLEQEVDNWDENAVDNWDEEDGDEPSPAHKAPAAERKDQNAPVEGGKRND